MPVVAFGLPGPAFAIRRFHGELPDANAQVPSPSPRWVAPSPWC